MRNESPINRPSARQHLKVSRVGVVLELRVTVVHRHLDRHGTGREFVRGGFQAPDGWPSYPAWYEALTRGDQVSA